MINYIIFKGIDSRTIEGLLICELPPITKPKLRVEETKIDGVDGSVIEELGYDTYTKSIKIGLYGNYNIDQIMDYFNGSGEIVFSNESDKYYNCKIIDSIDYKRLLRFKTATIKLHMQPFKYLYREIITKYSNPTNNIYVVNSGLLNSRPLIKLKGSGTINFSLNNYEVFKYIFPSNETEVWIDSTLQDAYLGNILKNRNMTGDFPILKPGKNIINISGNITNIEILPNSRWL